MKKELEKIATANALAAALLVEGLVAKERRVGVVLSPGSRNTPLALAFAAHPEVSLFVVLDERAAGFVALGMAKATGRAAIVVCTSGSAGAHYAPALTEASAAQIPFIMLTADRPLSLHGVASPQTVNQAGFGLGLVRESVFLEAPQACDADDRMASPRLRAWRTSALRARASAHDLMPGPVHINAPFAEPLWELDVDTQARGWVASLAPVTRVSPRLRAAPMRVLAPFFDSPRGLIVVGAQEGARHALKGLPELMARLCAHLGWPLLADAGSQMRVQGLASGYLCTRYTHYLRKMAAADVLRPTRILRLGAWPVSRPLQQYLQALEGIPQMMMGPDASICDPLHHVSHYVHVDVPRTLKRILALAVPGQDGGWIAQWQAEEKRAREAECESFGALERALCAAPRPGDYLYLGNSTPIRNVAHRAPAGVASGVTVVTSRGVCGIDGAIATLVGLSLARPRRHVFALMGDLTFLHDLGALQTALQFRTSITVVVVCNKGGRIFEQLPVKAHKTYFESLFVTHQKADLEALCQAAGATCRSFENPEALRDSLRTRGQRQTPAGLCVFLYRNLFASGPC